MDKTAEEKWTKWDGERAYEYAIDKDDALALIAYDSRNTFKQALRERIEKEISSAMDMEKFAQGQGDYIGTLIWAKAIFALNRILTSLDTVEPPKQ